VSCPEWIPGSPSPLASELSDATALAIREPVDVGEASSKRLNHGTKRALSGALASARGSETASRKTPKVAPKGADAFAVTCREQGIAALIAEGLTNRQIAGELFISERTVESHVRHILNKLGASSRARIAAWTVWQQLVGDEKYPASWTVRSRLETPIWQAQGHTYSSR
jgi:DNA-binding NarL/FixJ family response regulator